jgi:hypothetical protein
MGISRIFSEDGGTAPAKEQTSKDLTSQIGSSNRLFQLGQVYKTGTLKVYWNGIRQTSGVNLTETSSQSFTTVFTPNPGDSLVVDYMPI